MTKALLRTLAALLLLALLPLTAAAAPVALPIDDSPGLPPVEAGYLGDWEYKDPSIHVVIEKGREYNTDYWVARITIADPSQLRTAAAGGFDSQRTVSAMAIAKRMQAVLAINGDYFSYINDGHLVRQGTVYRQIPRGARDVLVIDQRGDFHIVRGATPKKIQALEAQGVQIVNSFNFGPALVQEGKRVGNFLDNDRMAYLHRQRMAIGQVKKGSLEYICVATAGPKSGNNGMDITQLGRLMVNLGVETAYNLDGGNSTSMMFRDAYVNSDFEETMRPISDIIYFASAGGE